MKIHTIARDVKQMQIAELKAINSRLSEVQAIPTDNGTTEQPKQTVEEVKEEAADTKAARSKKEKARVRSN